MEEIFKTLLKSLGLTDAMILQFETDLKDDEKKKKIDVKNYIDPIVEHQKTLFEADPNVVSKYTNAEKGKLMEQLDRRLKQKFGITAEELNGKTIEEKVNMSYAAAEKSMSKAGTELQQENITLKNQIKDLQEKEIPGIRAEVDNVKKSFRKRNEIISLINVKKMIGKVEANLPGLMSYLEDGYKIDITDSGEFKILTKSGLPVKSEDGLRIMPNDEIIQSYFTKNGLEVKSNAGSADDDETEDKKKVVVKRKDGAQEYMSEGLSKAEQNLAEQKKVVKK